ncbi:conserved hypothetical protein [Ricinus communis]|uniref:Uncharacterized protein n=1 Tax=Ricinus communis TaxID=3988 RepID=B9SJN9_RICCO|nr:conserved hypothetical protein [Ricinus communis]
MDLEIHESWSQTPDVTRGVNTCESRNRFIKKELLMEMKQQLLLAGPLVSVLSCLGFIYRYIFIYKFCWSSALSGASMADCTLSGLAKRLGHMLIWELITFLEFFVGLSYSVSYTILEGRQGKLLTGQVVQWPSRLQKS